MEKIFLEGFFLQASLIFALGAQNIFVLESGLKKQNYLAVSFVCFLCDLTLILLGVAGAATLFNEFPFLKIIIGIIGVFFLFTYGLAKITDRASFSLSEEHLDSIPLKKSLLLALTFSILNPHAYLDAFVLIGGYSSKYLLLNERMTLGLGAAICSGLWFLLLSSLSRIVRPVLLNPVRLKYVITMAGFALILLSGKLAFEVAQWMPERLSASFTSLILNESANVTLYSSILY